MSKGVPLARHANIANATREAKKVLQRTKSWERTKEHLYMWIKVTYALSRRTALDYLEDVYGRLSTDPDVKELLV